MMDKRAHHSAINGRAEGAPIETRADREGAGRADYCIEEHVLVQDEGLGTV